MALVDELLTPPDAQCKVKLSVEPLDLAVRWCGHSRDQWAVQAAGLGSRSSPCRPRAGAGRPGWAQVAGNCSTTVKFTRAGARERRVEVTARRPSSVRTRVGSIARLTLFPLPPVDADPARTKGGLGPGLAVVRGCRARRPSRGRQ